MSDEQSIRDEIERAFNEWWNAPHPDDGSDLDFSEYIMPLVRRAQASKVREVAELVMDPHNGLPFDTDHDLAIVSAWLHDVADCIEQEAGA